MATPVAPCRCHLGAALRRWRPLRSPLSSCASRCGATRGRGIFSVADNAPCSLETAGIEQEVRRRVEASRSRSWSRSWDALCGRPSTTGRSTWGKTEFEHGQDGAARRHLPKPGPGGFSRGTFIGWRRADRYGSDHSLSVQDLYEFEKTLGKGGFGTVYAARHRRTGEAVAIKSLPKDRVKNPEAELEVEFLKVADHPNLIRYYEAVEDAEHLHLIMELCSGGALSQHIKAAHDCHGVGFSESDLARIMIQLLRSVAYCHAHSIVHRDLKPENFLFGCGSPQGCSAIPISCCGTADAPLKLVDFGVSGVVCGDHPEKRWLTRRAGTHGYIAPEVLEGQPYGPPADLFSLGAVLHAMIAGEPPKWETERKRGYVFPGRMRWLMLSAEGQAFLQRLLKSDPSERPTAREALQDPWFEAMGVFMLQDVSRLHDECIECIRDFSRKSKLQRSIMYSMVAFAPLHNHYMEQLRIAFLAADKNVSGGITGAEFAEVMRQRNRGSGEEEERELFRTVNSSQSGHISYSEWLAAAAPQAWFDHHEYIRRAFETLDVNRNGYICAHDLCQVLPGIFQEEEIEEEIRCLNPGGNGRLRFKDFCALSGQIYTTSVNI